MKNKDNTETVVIGKVGSPSALKGEVRIILYAQDSNNLKEGKVLLLKHAEKRIGGPAVANGISELSAEVQKVRVSKDKVLVKLEGIDDRTAAERLTGMEVFISAEDLEPLPEGEHYVRDLIGCRVVDIASGQGGKEIGILRDVSQNTAQSLLEVETADGKTVLIPAVDAFMRSIDEEAGLIEVELIPGFLD